MFVVRVELGVHLSQARPAVHGAEAIPDPAKSAGDAQVGSAGEEDGDDARARVALCQSRFDRSVQVGID